MKYYVLGFVFDEKMENVIMMKKNRPEWQAGMLNGVGGKVEDNETWIEAMSREYEEEAGIYIHSSFWKHILTLRFDNATIRVYATSNSSFYENSHTITDEEIIKIPVRFIDRRCTVVLDNPDSSVKSCKIYKVIKNIQYLIPLCIERLSI